eukprot:Gregarina_sp_Poly_1__1242@NODE_1301_length_4434_cov_110_833524_g881_i0_p3_GENE_NODE_1301_length_4434_cov_110_833524_g881_i0NODE_1301_length_4434_cov_110_833524_g881_i0_p3_ORF_typecomplete_len306_score33_77PP2C/PF00481_21/1_5e29PP2C_2/PF13672_6/0_17_NODE_1301_length_4434_cov_110_833524_g881_i06271544
MTERRGDWWMGLSLSAAELDYRCTDSREFNIGAKWRLGISIGEERGLKPTMDDRYIISGSNTRFMPAHGSFQFTDNSIGWIDFALFGLATGHGGKQSSNFVKENLCKEVNVQVELKFGALLVVEAEANLEFLDTIFTDDMIYRLFVDVHKKLDTRIALEIPSSRDGCSLCILALPKLVVQDRNGHRRELCSETFFCMNLGDCGAFLCRRGHVEDPSLTVRDDKLDTGVEIHAIPLCEQHKPFVIEEKQRILASGGTIENAKVNGILKVTRSLGDLQLKKFGVLCAPSFKKFRLSHLQVPSDHDCG